jgi:F-type H+-transporting ATPase subunit b
VNCSHSSSRANQLVLAAAALVVAAPAQAAGDLVLIPHIPTLVVLLALFALLIAPMNSLIFRPLFRVLDEREDRIAGARRRAEHIASQADEVIERYRTTVRDVREEAEQGRRQHLAAARSDQQQVTGEARSHAERDLEASRAELAEQVDRARSELRASAVLLSREMAARVLGRAMS